MSTAAEYSEKAYVLVIDDDPLLTRTLKKVLERAGYFVDTAKDGHEGILKAKSGFFHLVLCDIRMPGLDGLMTIRRIQEFQDKAGAGKSGFVVVTAYETEENRRDAFRLGVTDFIGKPFDLNQFIETVGHHVMPLLKQTPKEESERLNQKLERLLTTLRAEENKERESHLGPGASEKKGDV
ncbi:MAG: response regulator [Candidatus Omnitrophica bacterium]|nr:response regulator [Candidatus Omnitrophota bacterium]